MHVVMLAAMGTSRKKSHSREILAENLRARRTRLGLSQEDFAEMLGFHRTYISSVERCQRNVSIDNLDRMAKALKLRVAELLAE